MAAERPTRRRLGDMLRPEPTLARAADALGVYTDALAAAHAPLTKRAHYISGGARRDDALMRLANVASSTMGMLGSNPATYGPPRAGAGAPRDTPDRVAERTARLMVRAAKKDTLSKVENNGDVGKPRAMGLDTRALKGASM